MALIAGISDNNELFRILFITCQFCNIIEIVYRVRQNYGNQGVMERYKFNSLSALN